MLYNFINWGKGRDKYPLIRKCLTVGIILLFLLLVFLSIHPSISAKIQRTIYVDDDNISGPWDGTQDHPFRHIQDGVVASSENDIIFVYNGFYREELFVNKSINLIGENKNNTIISEGYHNDFPSVILISTEIVTISNFTFTNSRVDSTIGCGIYVVNSTGIVISNNIFNSSSNLWSSITIKNSSQCIATKNFIDGGNGSDFMNEYGIIVGSSFNSLISNNLIQFHREAGIGLFNASNITILENKLLQNSFGCLIDLNSSNNIISFNTILKNVAQGIYLYANTHNNIVSGNDIVENGFGVSLFNSFQNTITRNNILSNKIYGLDFYSDEFIRTFFRGDRPCFGNVVSYNNFIGNADNAYFYSCYFNLWNSNYWDGPRNKPYLIIGSTGGFGAIKWVQFDWHPAQEPYDIPGMS